MEVRCPSCHTRHQLSADLARDGADLRCTKCQRLLRVQVAEPAVQPWLIRSYQTKEVREIDGLLTLQRWIVERKVSEFDEISRTGAKWKPLGAIGELSTFFAVVKQVESVEVPTKVTSRAEARLEPTQPGRGQRLAPMPAAMNSEATVKANRYTLLAKGPADFATFDADAPDYAESLTDALLANLNSVAGGPQHHETLTTEPADLISLEVEAVEASVKVSAPALGVYAYPSEEFTLDSLDMVSLDEVSVDQVLAQPQEKPELTAPPAPTPAAPAPAPAPAPLPRPYRPPRTRNWMSQAAILILALALVAGAFLWAHFHRQRPDSEEAPSPPAAPAPSPDVAPQEAAADQDSQPATPADVRPLLATPEPRLLAQASSLGSAGLFFLVLHPRVEEEAPVFDGEVVLREAERARTRGRCSAAIEGYQAILAREPKHARALGGLGWCELSEGRARNALAHFERAIDAWSGYESAYIGIAKAHEAAGDPRAALRAYERYLDRFPVGGESSIAQAQAKRLRISLGDERPAVAEERIIILQP